MRIIQIFRKKNQQFFSIESVYDRVRGSWMYDAVPKAIELPHNGVTILNLIFLRRYFRKNKKTLYHVTGDVHYAVLALPRMWTILTIHDCVFMNNYTGIRRQALKILLLDIPIWYSKYITTISEKTKQEIVEYTGCAASKITVIPNPVSPAIYFESKEINVSCPVFLFIGITPNKNFERVCEAIQFISCKLLIIGKLSERQLNVLRQFRITYEMEHGLSENAVAEKYRQADIVLFPSLYEGFGLPIIEGFKAGRAVLTSEISPMKNISENAACLVDPTNVDSIREGIIRLIHDKPYREELIQRGFVVAQKYKPEFIAEQYHQLYKKVYNKACVA